MQYNMLYIVALVRRYLTGSYQWVRTHRVKGAFIALVVCGAGYWGWTTMHPATTKTYYIMGSASTSTVVASLSESGTVSTTDTVAIQPQVSGQITWVGVQAGDKVRAGQAMVKIDNTTALQNLAAAKRTLASDKLTYQQSQAQAPITYQNSLDALTTAKTNLQNDYNTTYNDLVSAYLNLPTVINSAQSTMYGFDFDSKRSQWNMDMLTNLFTGQQDTSNVLSFKNTSMANYTAANTAYNAALATYQRTPRTADNATIDALLAQTISTETAIAQTLQSELNFFGAVSDVAQTYNITLPTKFTTVQSTATSNLATANNALTTLLNDQKTLQNDAQAITSAQNTIKLAQVGNPNGDNPISLQVSANNLLQEEQNIATMETNLANYTITAPFSGTVSAVGAQVGNNASGNLVTVISDSQIADMSVNEVDAAQIKVGDKATLTFDAIDGLTLTGKVAQINSVGTVSQGVVSYSLQIAFDSQDSRVKSGMTVTADIQTGVAANTLVVPSSAIKTSTDGGSYVLAFASPIPEATISASGSTGITSDTKPVQLSVVTGLTDGTNTQIISGLSAGQQIVVSTRSSTATASAATTATSRTSSTRIGGPGMGL